MSFLGSLSGTNDFYTATSYLEDRLHFIAKVISKKLRDTGELGQTISLVENNISTKRSELNYRMIPGVQNSDPQNAMIIQQLQSSLATLPMVLFSVQDKKRIMEDEERDLQTEKTVLDAEKKFCEQAAKGCEQNIEPGMKRFSMHT